MTRKGGLKIPRVKKGVCSICKCTEAKACPGGCSWVNPQMVICSRCFTGKVMTGTLSPFFYLHTTDLGAIVLGNAQALMTCFECGSVWKKKRGWSHAKIEFTVRHCPDCTDSHGIESLKMDFEKMK